MRSTFQRFMVGAGVAVAAFSATGCGSDSDPVGPVDPEDLTFHVSLGVNLSEMTKTASGLYYLDMVVGTGEEAEEGREVTVHYTAWLHDGTLIDSSRTFDDPFSFILGVGEVIPGWEEGIPGMKVGGERKLVIPYQLAYGASGNPTVPPYATLVFDVELLEVVVPSE